MSETVRQHDSKYLQSAMILDLDRNEFDREASRLLKLVQTDFHPDILVGIRSGGYFLAEAMISQSPEHPLDLVAVTRRRAMTKQKNLLKLKYVLGLTPRPVKNALRRLEHRVLMAIPSRRHVEPMTPESDEDLRLRAVLGAHRPDCRILIVDDAVDSGATLLAVMRYVKEAAGPAAEVRSAVITVTQPSPMIDPDYTLYRQVLCRFYWSSDFA